MAEPDLAPPVYCIGCKAQIPKEATSCPRCGRDQRERVLPPQPEAKKPAPRIRKSENGVRLMLAGWALCIGVQIVFELTGVQPVAVTTFIGLVGMVGIVVFFFGLYRAIVGWITRN